MKTYADWFDTQDSTSDDDLSLRRSTVRTLNFGWAGQNDCACTIIRSIVIFYLYACTCRQQSRVILSPRTITPTAIVSGCLQMLTWVSDRSIFNTFGHPQGIWQCLLKTFLSLCTSARCSKPFFSNRTYVPLKSTPIEA